MKTLTILNRLDIDVSWYFSGVSVGFTIHKRGIQLSLFFIDISFFYASPKWRLSQEERYQRIAQAMNEDWYEG
jgi:hypothetical protein